MSTRICSFRGVRVGEVFVPLVEQRVMHNYSLTEDRDGSRVRFNRAKKSGVVRLEHKTFSKWGGDSKPIMDNRQYAKTTEHLSETIGSGADAIFGATDRVVVVGSIDDMLKAAA